jgi:hypothetical protein
MFLGILRKDHRVEDVSKIVPGPIDPIFKDTIFTASQKYLMSITGLEEGDHVVSQWDLHCTLTWLCK